MAATSTEEAQARSRKNKLLKKINFLSVNLKNRGGGMGVLLPLGLNEIFPNLTPVYSIFLIN